MGWSWVWSYFDKSSRDIATCSICQKEISRRNSTTSGMLKHLKQVHDIEMPATETQQESMGIEDPINKKPEKISRRVKKLNDSLKAEKLEKQKRDVSSNSRLVVLGNVKAFTLPWEFFTKETKVQACCTLCKTKIRTPNYSTSGLLKHLKRVHGMTRAVKSNNVDADNDELPMTRETSLRCLNKCFVCNHNFESFPTKLNHQLGFSSKPLSEMLESLVGTSLDQTAVSKSVICEDCFTQLEKYDVYQHRCKEIQHKILDLYQQTHTEQVFVKQEPEIWYNGDIESSTVESTTNIHEAKLSRGGSVSDTEGLKSGNDSESDNDFLDSEGSEFEQKRKKVKRVNECSKCDFKTQKYRDLLTHSKTHELVEKGLQCDKCMKVCKNPVSMEIHLITEHCEPNDAFECPICFKCFETKQKFRFHYNTHKKVKNLLCIICGGTFDHKYAFKVHMMAHNDERPFPCEFPDCSKRFRTPSKRNIHHRVHTREKIYECPFCPDKRFAQSYGRDLHIKNHHKNEDLREACKICYIKIDTKAKMKLHLQHVHDVVETEMPMNFSDDY